MSLDTDIEIKNKDGEKIAGYGGSCKKTYHYFKDKFDEQTWSELTIEDIEQFELDTLGEGMISSLADKLIDHINQGNKVYYWYWW
jgi:hypothetical protein